MSNHPTAPHASTGRPTATYPTGCPTGCPTGQSPFAGWRDATPTELLPVVTAPVTAPVTAHRPGLPSHRPSHRRQAPPRVSTPAKPTAGRVARRTAPTGTKGLRRRGTLSRHLRAALAAIALAAAILIPMQLFAAQGISSARQAALTARSGQTSASAVPMSGQSTHSEQGAPSPMSGQSPAQPEWVTEHTGAAYDRTNPHASPLDLPRCTTSPSTPLPCLATISPSQTRAVVLEEDASLTALVRR